jgi:hypothetical protein
LALVRRILGARNPGALRELDDGLAVAGGGEAALVAWLARPLAPAVVDDPLEEMLGALAKLKVFLAELGPNSIRAASLAQAMATLGKGIEQVRRGRPRPETEDQALARLRALDEDALALIEGYTVQAEVRAARALPGAPHGVCVTCERPLTAPLAEAPKLP